LFGSAESTNGSGCSTYYASNYNILEGTHLYGSAPSSVTSVDADYLIVTSVGTATSVVAYNPNGYTLLGSTSWVSGTVSNLASNDGVHMVFSSYFIGSEIEDYVDNNTSNVDSITDKGAHSNFTAQQYAPDSVYDTLTEEDTSGETGVLNLYVNADDENKTDWSRTGTNPHLDAIDYNASYVYVSGNNMLVGDFGFTDSGKSTETINNVTVQLYAKQSLVDNNLEVTVWNGSVWASLGVQGTPSSWGWMNWTATTELDTWTKIDGAKIYIQSRVAAGTYEVDCARLQVDYAPTNYELDLEVQWTSVDYNQENEELCIYTGTVGNEDLCIDYWNGSRWISLFTDLTASSWNNVSVSLTGATFTIRFRGGAETSDSTQDTWEIDAVLLHAWTNQYTSEVEFTGSPNNYSWKQLNCTFASAWTIASVSVTIQLYNYTLGDYPISGNGFMTYTSNAIANTDETKTLTITTDHQHFRDSAGNWKIKVKGAKTTTTQFDFKADWCKFEPTYWSEYTVSTEFLFSTMTSNTTQLNFTVVNQYNIAGVGVTIQVWNYSASAWATSGEAYLEYTSSGANETKLLSINSDPQFHTSNGDAKIKITGVSSTTTQYQQETNQIKLVYSYVVDSYVHDVATINVTASATEVDSGRIINITVAVKNNGTVTETFNVTLFYDETAIGTKNVANLAPGDQKTLGFAWNTTGIAKGSYIIRAEAESVSEETNKNNNAYTGPIIRVATQTSLQPFDWAMLYALLAVFGLVFLSAVKLRGKKRTKTNIEKKTDKLSGWQQMVGKTMLLEIDPASDYQKVLSSFVSEVKNSNEPLFIVTKENSTLHSTFSGENNARFLLLTSKASPPQPINEKETYLPASGLSALLHACEEIKKVAAAPTEKTVNLIFDNLSDIIHRFGSERTHKFTRLLLKEISSPKTRVLFLFNPAAHDQVISSFIRDLFHINLAYPNDGEKAETLRRTRIK